MDATACPPVSTAWIGLDVSADSFDVCIWPDAVPSDVVAVKRLPTCRFARTPDGVRQLIGQLDPHTPACLVMESTGRYSTQIGEWVAEHGRHVTAAIVNPRRIRAHAKALGMRSKTDTTDARAIASYAAHFRPKPWQPMPPCYQTLQTLTRLRQSLVEHRTRILNQKRDLAMQTLLPAVRAAMTLSLDTIANTLSAEIDNARSQLDQLLAQNPDLERDVQLADTIPGVGAIVALTVIAEMGDVRRFRSRKEAETFAGLNVALRQSGRSLSATIGLAKEGSNRLRRVLYTAAMAATRTQTPLAQTYHSMVARGKHRKAALGALMRKICATIRRCIIDHKPYDPPPLKNPNQP